MDAEILSVLVRALGYVETEVVGDAEQVVDPFRLAVDVDYAVERKYAILVGVGDEEGARCDKRGYHGVVPAGGVDLVHAVAMALDAAVDDVIAHTGDSRNGNGGLYALVEGGDPPTVGSPTRPTGDADAFTVDLGTGLQVVDTANAVPCLYAGGGVSS